DEILGGKLREPAAVEVHHGFFLAENFENLRLVGLGILRNLLLRQRRPGRRAARRIADHSGEISDEEDDRVSEVLKMFQLAQQNRVPEVQIGRGRIEARFHPQRLARSERAFELGAQFGFLDNLRRALLEVCQLFFDRWKVGHVVFDYNDPSCLLSFARAIPLRIVIPNKVRDLYFAAKLQIPHFVRDDNSGELRILDPVAGRSSARRLPVPVCGSAVVRQTPLLDRIFFHARRSRGSARAVISIPPAWPVSSRIHPASSRVDRETRSRHRFPLLPTDARLSRRRPSESGNRAQSPKTANLWQSVQRLPWTIRRSIPSVRRGSGPQCLLRPCPRINRATPTPPAHPDGRRISR